MDCILPKYRLSEEEYDELWKNCTFVLDTNMLLNIYRYSPKIRDQILAILEKISENLWIPYQVALEYYDNRSAVISKELSKYKTIINLISNCQKPTKNEFDKELKRKHTTASEILEFFENEFKDLESAYDTGLKELKEKLEKSIATYPNREDLENLNETICSLFDGKVGKPYSIKELEQICNNGSKRYELMLPPGYGDKSKPGIKKYGDLIIWFQIMDFAKENSKHIIFLCDDLKDDWWWSPSDTTLGPRPELIHEFTSETKQLFYMYPPDRFMKWSKNYIKVDIKDEVIEELRDYRVEEGRQLKDIRSFMDIARATYFNPKILESIAHVESIRQEALANFDPKISDEFAEACRRAATPFDPKISDEFAEACRQASLKIRKDLEATKDKYLDLEDTTENDE